MSKRIQPLMFIDTSKKPGDADCVKTEEDILAENKKLKAEIKRLRQPGNVAALREFAEYLANYPTCEGCEGKKDSRFCESCPKGVALAPITLQARVALAKPPRNCDRFESHGEALDAWVLWRGDNLTVHDGIGKAKQPFPHWLFAPATEKEGGEK